ncbi:hypothetical protein Tco_0036402 [Tanacetum coccineum]
MWTCSRESYMDLRHMKIIRIRGCMNGIEKSRGLKKNQWLDYGTWKEPNDDISHKYKPFQFKSGHIQWPSCNSNEDGYFNRGNFLRIIQVVDQELFDRDEPMQDNDDDDIMDLEDYFIRQDACYFVDEEEERFKKRKSILLGMPYEKPPTFKSKKFKVTKYSLGPEEEYVTIKEYEYDIWLRTEENVSHVYENKFRKKDEGWSVTCMK